MVTEVMVEERANLPAVDRMCGKGWSGGGRFVE